LKWVRAQTFHDVELTPVVVISGSISNEDVRLAYQCGANCVITKPADWGKTRERIGGLLMFLRDYMRTV